MKVISKKILGAIKESQHTKNRLAYELNVTSRTIDNYIDGNSILLTSATALLAIREELKLDESVELLEEA